MSGAGGGATVPKAKMKRRFTRIDTTTQLAERGRMSSCFNVDVTQLVLYTAKFEV